MECEVSVPRHESTSMVGLDVGIVKLSTLSDGSFFKPVNSLKKEQEKLARLQCEISCKVKFSNHWKKAKRKVEKMQAHIHGDYLHKLGTTLSNNNIMVVIEDLKAEKMSKSAVCKLACMQCRC